MPMRLAGDFNVGAQLIGICINLVLYGVELVLAACYLSSARAKRDRKFILFAVISSLIVDTLACIALCAGIFMLLVVDWGSSVDSLRINWTYPLWIFTTGLNEFIVEAFMTQRYYRLSSNSVVSFLILVLMLLSLSASLYFGIDVSKATSKYVFVQLDDKTSVTINLASTVVTDVCITCALSWKLLARENSLSLHTEHLVRRVAAFAIVTGAVTASVSLVTLITFLVNPRGGISPCFAYFLGRVYTLTMLFTLVFRGRLAGKAYSIYIDFEDDTELTPMPTSASGSGATIPMSIDEEMVFAVRPVESLRSGRGRTQEKEAPPPDSIDISSTHISAMEKYGNPFQP